MTWIDRLLPLRKRVSPGTTVQPRFVFRAAATADAEPEEAEFPRFQITAGDQLDPRKADEFALIRSRLRNAYTPAQPVTDRRMFAGRTKLMTTLIRLIEDQRLHTVIYGERGIGKTSLLQVLAK